MFNCQSRLPLCDCINRKLTKGSNIAYSIPFSLTLPLTHHHLFVIHPFLLNLVPQPDRWRPILFLRNWPSPFPPSSSPSPLLSTHSHPLLSHILPSSGPERWRCTPISFWKAWDLLFLLQLSLLGPLTMVTGRGWGKGVVHHGCSMRDHRVGVGEGGGSGSSELP